MYLFKYLHIYICTEHPDQHLGGQLDERLREHLGGQLDEHILEHLLEHLSGHLHKGGGSERRRVTSGIRKGVHKCVRTVFVKGVMAALGVFANI